jgi:hypothetical protein
LLVTLRTSEDVNAVLGGSIATVSSSQYEVRSDERSGATTSATNQNCSSPQFAFGREAVDNLHAHVLGGSSNGEGSKNGQRALHDSVWKE